MMMEPTPSLCRQYLIYAFLLIAATAMPTSLRPTPTKIPQPLQALMMINVSTGDTHTHTHAMELL
jgi:hypothetical protein